MKRPWLLAHDVDTPMSSVEVLLVRLSFQFHEHMNEYVSAKRT